ncbi:MAG: hypothetical protein A2Z45_07000 [Chloroflexi bacterium RBG_19FT_COMBO_55_16]|nr:MAG: hypothetical protein A2Z45_07000 [Chloroflexi bacterium RBG_19FT_COMBO_55_16]
MAPSNKIIFFLVIVSTLFAAGCQSNTDPKPPPAPSPTSAEVLPGVEGYPYPVPIVFTPVSNAYDESYPAPEITPVPIQLPESLVIPEPGKDTGIVVGQLVSGPDNQPVLGALYLARTIKPDEGDLPPIVAFSDSTDPLAVQDQTGRFLFTDITPGIYALVIWNPVTSTVIQDEGTEDYRLIEVKAGEVTDLGTITLP